MGPPAEVTETSATEAIAADGQQQLDDAIEALRARVEARKTAGEYPTDLDARLEVLAQIARSRVASPELDAAFARLTRTGDFGRHRITYSSRRPLGSFFHKLVGRLTTRQIDGLILQMREYAEALDEVMTSMATMIGRRETIDSISHRVDLALEQIATMQRTASADAADVPELTRRIQEIEKDLARARFTPWYSNEAFEDAFRGTRAQILETLRPLAHHFVGCAPVLDFGCGRGEMLEILRDLGVEARGAELDPDLVEAVRARGLTAEVADGMDYLRGSVDGSLGGIFLGQVIEHLTTQQVTDLVALASIKLRRGGRLIIETPNNQSLYTFARGFYIDPTHARPVPPAYLAFLVKQAGFTEWGIDWHSPVPADEQLDRIPDTSTVEVELIAHLNRSAERVNQILFGPQDYALIATR
jgi:2-polyprenyl-3-methyl-5-hydroxy-6-metoxy-1,4-benzoquinol methylase